MVHIEAQSDVVAIWVEYCRVGNVLQETVVSVHPGTIPWRTRIDKETGEKVFEYLL